MLKNDRWIRKMAREHDMINPFSEKQVREGVISYGLSSYGYDLRVADEFKIFTNLNSSIVDPKNFDEKSFVTIRTDIASCRQFVRAIFSPSVWARAPTPAAELP
jgi:dCTP deaminase